MQNEGFELAHKFIDNLHKNFTDDFNMYSNILSSCTLLFDIVKSKNLLISKQDYKEEACIREIRKRNATAYYMEFDLYEACNDFINWKDVDDKFNKIKRQRGFSR